MAPTHRPHVLREGERAGRVTNVELFFDLVYVFAVTQLSELLVRHATGDGVFQTAILLAMVWQVWAYTTWTINYLDPNRTPVRGLLIVLMLGSLVLAAALPEAFEQHGLLVAVTYVAMQAGRSVFTLWELRGERLQLVYRRLLPWTLVSGAVAIVGGLAHGHVREALWIVSIVIDLIGAGVGFYVPGIGRSATTEWTINGGHFAERCIIVTAAADERVLAAPGAHGNAPTAWLILGGTALFLAGHALFKGIFWHVVSWPRVAGAVVLLTLGALAPNAAVLTLGVCALAVIAAVAVADRITQRRTPEVTTS